MPAATTVNCQQYAKWIRMIARSLWINPPDAPTQSAVESFCKFIWDPELRVGTREWLDTEYNMRSVSANTEYIGDPDIEPNNGV